MLTKQQLGWLTKKTEVPEYNKLMSQLNSFGGKSGVIARINSLVSNIANIKTQLKTLADNNFSLANERDNLQKAHASLLEEIRKQELIKAQQLIPVINVMPAKKTLPATASSNKKIIRVKFR